LTTFGFWAREDVDEEEDVDEDSEPVDDLFCRGSASPIRVILTGL